MEQRETSDSNRVLLPLHWISDGLCHGDRFRALRSVLLILVVIPFWTNFVVRAYALKVLLGEHGPVNRLAMGVGLIHEPIVFANTTFAVWLGMVTNYLPFMVLPLYVALEKFDFALLEAAKDLGAPRWKAFWQVLVPLTRPGIITGTIFVFTRHWESL